MFIFYSQVNLDEGFTILETEIKADRLVRGRQVSRPSGWHLFDSLRGQPIKCWQCGIEADRWVAEKGRRDNIGSAVLNLHAGTVLMTRDHIVPKSLGGVDDIGNLRPGCSPCNERRGNEVTPEVTRFAQEHPELIDKERIKAGLESLQTHLRRLEASIKSQQQEVERLKEPYRKMGYI